MTGAGAEADRSPWFLFCLFYDIMTGMGFIFCFYLRTESDRWEEPWTGTEGGIIHVVFMLFSSLGDGDGVGGGESDRLKSEKEPIWIRVSAVTLSNVTSANGIGRLFYCHIWCACGTENEKD